MSRLMDESAEGVACRSGTFLLLSSGGLPASWLASPVSPRFRVWSKSGVIETSVSSPTSEQYAYVRIPTP